MKVSLASVSFFPSEDSSSLSLSSLSEVRFRLPPRIEPRLPLLPRGRPPRPLPLPLPLPLPRLGEFSAGVAGIMDSSLIVPRAVGLLPRLAPRPLLPPVMPVLLGPEGNVGLDKTTESAMEDISASTASRAAIHWGEARSTSPPFVLTRARSSLTSAEIPGLVSSDIPKETAIVGI